MPERILLVEDDDEIAGLVQLHLGDQGYAVERLANGARGAVATHICPQPTL